MYASHQPSQFSIQSVNIDQSTASPVVYQEYLASSGWLLQWRIKKNWLIEVPQIKECKKRKDGYSKIFEPIFYKAPYKYHLNCVVTGIKPSENIVVQINLNYENGENIVKGDTAILSNGRREIHSKKMEKIKASNSTQEVTIGPYQFNVCSFRQDGRKFRIVLYFFEHSLNAPAQMICSIISQPFTIRAKKPIKNPGTRGKRKRKPKSGTSKKRKLKEKPAPIKTKSLSEHLQINVGREIVVPQVQYPNPYPITPGVPGLPHPQMPPQMPPQIEQTILPPPPQQRVNLQFPQPTNTNRIDMLDVLLSEQEEPEEKLKSFHNVILSEYTDMNSEKRIDLLTRLLEISYPTELSFIKSLFFDDDDKVKPPQIFDDMEKLVNEDY